MSGRRVVRDFETHLVAEPARRQLALERAQQIVDFFFVDEQIAVARDSELIAAGDFHAGEQVADVGVHDRRQKHEVVRRLRDRRRQPHQSRQRARHLHHRFAAGAAECIFAFERHDEAQALVQHLRKRVRGIESHRAQDRHEVVREIVTQPLRLLLVPAIARNEADAFGIEPRQKQLVQHAILFVEQFVRHLRDGPQLIGRRQIVGPALRRAERLLMNQSGNADLEEFIEVRVGDAEERQALEQRHVVVLGEFEYAPVELEQRQLPVEVQLRAGEIRGGCVHRARIQRVVNGGRAYHVAFL